jgi:hypothetical protein
MTDILVDDHAEVDALLRGVLLAFDGGDSREVLSKLDYLWARLAIHIRAEHLHLFPALLSAAHAEGAGRTLGTPTAREVLESVESLREDHDFFMHELAGAVNAARHLAALDDADDREGLMQIKGRVLAVAARLAEHNRVEEEQVYRWPEALLSPSQLSTLPARMKHEIENLPPRFSEDTPRKEP